MPARGEPRIDLPGVTLVAVTSVALEATANALITCLQGLNFERVLLLSDQPLPPKLTGIVEHRAIKPLRSKTDYSRFMLSGLARHIETEHALCVQWDGFTLDPARWTNEFREFDYIGAVWPHFDDGYNVGNGGFSLRSKRLLELTAKISFDGIIPEDLVIARVERSSLEAQGVRFAPEEVARRFAFEREKPNGQEFGFHGVFNLARCCSAEEIFSILTSLEPQVLTRGEQKELLRWATRMGYLKIASLLIRRIMRQRVGSH